VQISLYNNIVLTNVIRVNRERIRLFFTAERHIIINIYYNDSISIFLYLSHRGSALYYVHIIGTTDERVYDRELINEIAIFFFYCTLRDEIKPGTVDCYYYYCFLFPIAAAI